MSIHKFISTGAYFTQKDVFYTVKDGVILASLPGHTARLEKINFEICLLPQIQRRIKLFQRILAKDNEGAEGRRKNLQKLIPLKGERDAIKSYNIEKLIEMLEYCFIKRYVLKHLYQSQVQKFGYSSSEAIFFCPESELYDPSDLKEEEKNWEKFQEKCVYKGRDINK